MAINPESLKYQQLLAEYHGGQDPHPDKIKPARVLVTLALMKLGEFGEVDADNNRVAYLKSKNDEYVWRINKEFDLISHQDPQAVDEKPIVIDGFALRKFSGGIDPIRLETLVLPNSPIEDEKVLIMASKIGDETIIATTDALASSIRVNPRYYQRLENEGTIIFANQRR